MEQTDQVRAISPTKSVVFILLTAACYFCVIKDIGEKSEMTFILCLLLILLPSDIYYLIHTVHLTPLGVECRRFGRVYRQLLWKEVGQVCVVNDMKWHGGPGVFRRIIITPTGCREYDEKTSSGYRYLFALRGKAIWIDDIEQNKQFILRYYGEVMDCTRRKFFGK